MDAWQWEQVGGGVGRPPEERSAKLGALLTQLLPVCVLLPTRRILSWLCYSWLWLALMERGVGRLAALLVSLALTKGLASVGFPLAGVGLKWLVMGRYKRGRHRVWSTWYLRWWFVDKSLKVNPKKGQVVKSVDASK